MSLPDVDAFDLLDSPIATLEPTDPTGPQKSPSSPNATAPRGPSSSKCNSETSCQSGWFDILCTKPPRDHDYFVPRVAIEIWTLETSNAPAAGRVTRSRERDRSASSVTEPRARSSSQRTSSRDGVDDTPTGISSPAASVQERGRSRRNSGQLPPVVPTAGAAAGVPSDTAPVTGVGPDDTAADPPTGDTTSDSAAIRGDAGAPPPGDGPPDGDGGDDDPADPDPPASPPPRRCPRCNLWLSRAMTWPEHDEVCNYELPDHHIAANSSPTPSSPATVVPSEFPPEHAQSAPESAHTPGRRVTEEQVAMDLQGIEGLQSSPTSDPHPEAASSPAIITHTEHVRDEGTLTESAYAARLTASAVKAEKLHDAGAEAADRPRSTFPPPTYYDAVPFSSSVNISSLTATLPFQDRVDLQSPAGARTPDAPTETPARAAARESRRQSSGGYTLVHGSDGTSAHMSDPPAPVDHPIAPPTLQHGETAPHQPPNHSLPHLSASDSSYTSTTAPPIRAGRQPPRAPPVAVAGWIATGPVLSAARYSHPVGQTHR